MVRRNAKRDKLTYLGEAMDSADLTRQAEIMSALIGRHLEHLRRLPTGMLMLAREKVVLLIVDKLGYLSFSRGGYASQKSIKRATASAA